jgi:L-threonylcarbamoyladenylate synthase
VGPSANPSGRISPTTAEHVRQSFAPEQVQVLDGGPCRAGIESTVVKLSPRVQVLRPGLISTAAIEAVLGVPVQDAGDHGELRESPGQLAVHYAPRTPTVLVRDHEINAAVRRYGRAVVLSHQPLKLAAPHRLVEMPSDPHEYARRLYAALREADDAGADCIVIARPEPAGSPEHRALWHAVLDRLTRASTRE